MRPTKDATFMAMARVVAERSTCARLKVGCMVMDPERKRVLGFGYNGNYAGGPNECDGMEPGKCGDLHAELNALLKCDNTKEKVAYVTTFPCVMCAKAMVNAGVKLVIYGEMYRDQGGVRVFSDANVEMRHEQG